MLLGRLRLSGLGILLLLATAACSSADAGAVTPPVPEDAAVASYTPPAGAPGFCTTLASGSELPAVSDAMGMLAVAPSDVGAKVTLGNAITELRGVLREMQSQGGPLEVEASVEKLVTALQQAKNGIVTDAVRTAVVAGLDDVASGVQPICGFPT